MNKKKKSTNTSPYPDKASKKNRAFPTGNALLSISLLSVAFGRVRPIQGRILFFILSLIF